MQTLESLSTDKQQLIIDLWRKKHSSHYCVKVANTSYESIIDLWNHYKDYHLIEVFRPFPQVQYLFDMIQETSMPILVLFSLCSKTNSLCLLKSRDKHIYWVDVTIPRLQELIRQAKTRKRTYSPLCFAWVYTL